MGWLNVLFLFGLVYLVYGDIYNDLANDECFLKAYLCDDHRVSITAGTEFYPTDPAMFGEICRKHKDFISCITKASEFCAKCENKTEFATVTLDNRMSLQKFCVDVSWRRNYFASVSCINKYKEYAWKECSSEESKSDRKPSWCIVSEPCEIILREINCTVKKIENYCNPVAAEVFRRLYLLKTTNQDVICGFRTRDPSYCRYRPTRIPHPDSTTGLRQTKGLEKRAGALASSVSEILFDKLLEITFNTKIIKEIIQESELIENEKFKEDLGDLLKLMEEYDQVTSMEVENTKLDTSKRLLKSSMEEFKGDKIEKKNSFPHQNIKNKLI